ncbi:MAG TPA: response regulator transcription factor [Flavobacteriaceae bacterium]|nr:response regulator transcription factor [Flavobacteriaceae bacterium]
MAKVVIYEDNVPLRESVASLLELSEKHEVLGTFGHCDKVKTQLQKLNPDVVLMDIDLPGTNGIEAVGIIRKFNKTVQIIILTIFDDNDKIFKALSAGANGYLLKKNISEKLLVSIEEVLRGGAPMSPSIARKIIENLKRPQPTDVPDYKLTQREQEILEYLAMGNSFKLIAAELKISLDTVRTHIKHIYDKLHVRSQIEAVCKAYRENLI